MNWKQLGQNILKVLKKVYATLELVFLKAFRGLLMEKKDGGWELSKGNVAFWMVLAHCMYVWSGNAAGTAVSSALDAAADTAGAVAVEEVLTEDNNSGLLDTLAEAVGTSGLGSDVSQQEFWLLMALLAYAVTKNTKGSMTNMVATLRGNR